jgi:hypothetical protein
VTDHPSVASPNWGRQHQSSQHPLAVLSGPVGSAILIAVRSKTALTKVILLRGFGKSKDFLDDF